MTILKKLTGNFTLEVCLVVFFCLSAKLFLHFFSILFIRFYIWCQLCNTQKKSTNKSSGPRKRCLNNKKDKYKVFVFLFFYFIEKLSILFYFLYFLNFVLVNFRAWLISSKCFKVCLVKDKYWRWWWNQHGITNWFLIIIGNEHHKPSKLITIIYLFFFLQNL